MSIESVIPFNNLILCHPLLLLPSIFPCIRVFSNELALRMRWPKYWSFSFNISPSNESSGKGDQSWVFTGRTDVEAETPIFWPPDVKSWLIWKDPDAGKDWGQEEKGRTEDEMVGWHHRLNGQEFGWTPGVGDGQGGLACCSSWGRKESDTTEQLNWTELNPLLSVLHHLICAVVSFMGYVNTVVLRSDLLPRPQPSSPTASAVASLASQIPFHCSSSLFLVYFSFLNYQMRRSWLNISLCERTLTQAYWESMVWNIHKNSMQIKYHK